MFTKFRDQKKNNKNFSNSIKTRLPNSKHYLTNSLTWDTTRCTIEYSVICSIWPGKYYITRGILAVKQGLTSN